MSFRLFIYYCAVCGGCAAYVGWVLGNLTSIQRTVTQTAVRGLLVGLVLGLALAVVDAVGNLSRLRVGAVGLRALVAGASGCVAGFLGGMLGQALFSWKHWSVFVVLGWTLTGLLIGGSLGIFDILSRLMREEDLRGAARKTLKGLLGGSLGGLLGGILFLLLQRFWGAIFEGQSLDGLWSPGATGFVALGLCIGLLIGLAQVILKEAWVRVEAGFRPGRELILTRPEITIGRAENCDIGLFGDAGVEKLHARIMQQGQRYLLADADTPTGTFLNDEPIDGPTPLRSGDLIRVGRSTLRFRERRKRGEE
jgi:hypothetical protein